MGRNDSQRNYRYSGNSLNSRKRASSWRWFKWFCLALIVGLIAFVGYNIYELYCMPVGRNTETVYLTVNKERSIEKLRKDIHTKIWPRYPKLLDNLFEYYDLSSKLTTGRYEIKPEMSTMEVFNILYKGIKSPVTINLRGIRTDDELIGYLTSRLLLDDAELRKALFNDSRLERLQMDYESIRSLFFAQSYEIDWAITGEELMQKFEQEYQTFWTPERRAKLDSLQITAPQAVAFAAILEEESSKRDEYPQIARLYLNRYHISMPLQSDPTVKFALEDFRLKRILNEHLEVDSPYNTYRNVGITPGPIRLVSPETIDAVLNAPPHEYLYMCAKEDFSGYHNFTSDYNIHLRNAKAYQRALNAKGIK